MNCKFFKWLFKATFSKSCLFSPVEMSVLLLLPVFHQCWCLSVWQKGSCHCLLTFHKLNEQWQKCWTNYFSNEDNHWSRVPLLGSHTLSSLPNTLLWHTQTHRVEFLFDFYDALKELHLDETLTRFDPCPEWGVDNGRSWENDFTASPA